MIRQDSPIHRHLFWVAVSVLQLDEVSLYAAGLALIEQNLHMLDSMNLFDNQARLALLLLLLLSHHTVQFLMDRVNLLAYMITESSLRDGAQLLF